MNEEEVPD